jgi:general stress protein 26
MSAEDRLWTLIEEHPTCMMTTVAQDGTLRARVMRAITERARNEIWFYTRVRSGKSEEIDRDGETCLCFAAPKASDYASVSGVATLTRDPELIRKHWSRFVDAWFPEGPSGDDVGMIRVDVRKGEYWDGESSSVLAALKMLHASANDELPDLGENRKVAF